MMINELFSFSPVFVNNNIVSKYCLEKFDNNVKKVKNELLYGDFDPEIFLLIS